MRDSLRDGKSVPHIIEIDEACDPRLKRYANLRGGTNQRLDDTFVVEGRWCLRRLIESHHAIMSVLVQRGKEDEVASWVSETTPVYSLPAEQIRRLVGFDFHRGMLACGRRPRLLSIDELDFRRHTPKLALAILGVTDAENLGSIMRTAAALGIENLLIGPKTEDPYGRRSIRVSMASVFKQRLYSLDDPQTQLSKLQQAGKIRTIVTTLDASATPLDQFVAGEVCVADTGDRASILIVGNEAEGVDRSVQDIATDRITIPMHLGTDSLNVAVAAAIFMYELLSRQTR